jgi:hypothetical protein
LGQADRGTFTGRVTDVTGGVVPGAEVTATNQETGVQSTAVTNEVGLYTMPNIPIGTYKLTYSLTGFKTHERSGITLAVAQALRLDVVLEPGEITETVTVSANAALLNRENPLVATTMQSEIITDLPLSFSGGRAVENFAYAVTPAVEGNNWTSYLAGGPAFSKEVLIDGITATSQIQGHIGESSPTMEAVQEFKVQTSGMSAEYGHTSGGVFNFALKSGTNDLHGSAFYYARNEALNANSWMNNWLLSKNPNDPRYKRPRDRQAVGGGSLGGPIVIPKIYDGRNKTFIFGAFEHYVQQRLQLGSMNVTVPLPEFLDGDFSKLLTTTQVGTDALGRPVYSGQIFDPKTLRQVGGKWVSDPFQGNIIPKNRMSTVSSKVIDLFRKHYVPMLPGVLTNNSARTYYNDPWFHQTQLTIKADHSISNNNKLIGSLIWIQRPRILVDQGGVWDPLDPTNTGGPFARSRKQEVTSRSLRLADNMTFGPNLINTLSVAYSRYRNPSLSTQSEGDWASKIGLGGSTSARHFPDVGFGSAVNGVGMTQIGYSAAGFYVCNTYVVNDSIDWIRGRHNMQFGAEFWHQQINSHAGIDTLGFGFANTQTGIPGESWSNRVGFGFASFFLGEAASGSKNVPFDLYGRRNFVAFYAQDDFKVTNRLTLNLGLRWDQSQPYTEKYGRWANFSPNVMNTDYGVKGALEFPSSPSASFEGERDWKAFAPRLGLAYQLTDKAVLRASYGMFYMPLGIQYWSGVPYGFAPGYRGTNTQTTSGNVPKFNWDAGYPDNYKAPNQNANTLIWGMVAIDQESLKMAYTHQYNVSFQYEFTNDTMLEATFMGNEGRRLHNGALKRNQPQRAAYEDPKVNPFAWIWDAASAAGAGVSYPYSGFSAYAGFALQPYPHVAAVTWGPVYYVGTPLGESAYRSLQFSLTKRLSSGTAAQMSYNYSRATSNSETAWDETWDATQGVQDMYDLSKEPNIITGYDQTHIFKGLATYQLPFGQGRKYLSDVHPAAEALLGGWNLTTVFRYNSGNGMGVSPNVSYPGWDGAVYADFNSSVDLSPQFNPRNFDPGNQGAIGNRYFDPAAFSDPKDHKLGNGKRRYEELRGFGYANEDIGIMKYWNFGETAKLQFRAEFLNLFNRHRYSNPSTSLSNKTTFGQVTTTTGVPRNIQLGLRLAW